jgi:uncharacterized membrane protein YfcA
VEPGPLRDALTLVAGVGTGVLSGAFGVGGAVISTPAIRALGASATISIGTTLPSILPGAVVGSWRYARDHLLDTRAIAAAAPAGIVCAVIGARTAHAVPGDGHWLQLLTAGFLAFTAVRTWRGRATPEGPAEERPPPIGPLVAVGAAAGFLSGLLGVGGGIIMVPGFSQLGALSLKRSIATSLACVGIFAIPGTIAHQLQHGIDWRFAIPLAIGVVPGARIGAAAALRASDHRLRIAVAVLLGAIAVVYAAGEVAALR